MSRPLRIEYENAVYHVMNRGRGRQQIFHGKEYYAAFLQGITEADQRFGLEILAYCLMGNHYHLLIKTPRGNLSRAMRHVNGLYTQRHNRLKRTDGPLFRGRYKALLIDTSAYLLTVSRYIHRNPIERQKPMVRKLEAYPWSSYPAYINKTQSPDWLYRDDIYGEMGSHQRYRGYQTYVEAGNDEETRKFYTRKQIPAIWGDKAFSEVAYSEATNWSNEIKKSGVVEPISIKKIVRSVAQHYQIDEQSIYLARRGVGNKNIPRWVAMKLSQDHSGQTLTEIGNAFGVGNYCTVSQTISRLRQLIECEKIIGKQLNTISKDLTR